MTFLRFRSNECGLFGKYGVLSREVRLDKDMEEKIVIFWNFGILEF